MEDPFSQGFPFDLDDIWRRSTLGTQDNATTLFQPHLTDGKALELHHIEDHYLDDFHQFESRRADDLSEPDLDRIEDRLLSPESGPSFDISATDIWSADLALQDAKKPAQLFSWESFGDKSENATDQPAYLSEASPEAVDIAFSRLEGSPERLGVLPQDVMLRNLCNLVHGKSSIFFQWDSAEARFVPTLPNIPLSGLSRTTSASIMSKMVTFGSMYRVAEEFASSRTAIHSACTALVAFKRCLTDILNGLERLISDGTRQCRSLIQLQGLIERPYDLLLVLCELKDAVKGHTGDEEVISALSKHVQHVVTAESCFAKVLRFILSRTSGPWLERLSSELGLPSESTEMVTGLQSDADAVDDESDASLHHALQPVGDKPSFISTDEYALVTATRVSAKAFRQHLPGHQLQSSKQIDPARSSGDITELPLHHGQELANSTSIMSLVDHGESPAWADEAEQLGLLTSLDTRIAQPLDDVTDYDELSVAIAHAMDHDTDRMEFAQFSTTMDFDPLEQLRPTLLAHQQLLNKTLLRHMFQALRLRHHLDIQRQYHLLGNGNFVARLATALFSSDTQSAERKRGVIPTGETMGLRLGAREDQRWAPASSELRLTLMGVLTETYRAEAGGRNADTKELPGDLSFSIRELPDAEIDRVMDAESIYALDFLRLQYTAPPCIDVIITPSALQVYDSIFRFSLRLLRVIHVTSKLRENILPTRGAHVPTSSTATSSDRSRMEFAREAHQTISVLMSHFMDVGIETQWRTFASAVEDLERTLDSDQPTQKAIPGLDELRRLHNACLERMRSRLFLRRKQEKIRAAIEHVLANILSCASTSEQMKIDGAALDTRSFKQSVEGLSELLQTTAEHPRKGSSNIEADESDAEAMKMLLRRLRWASHTNGSK